MKITASFLVTLLLLLPLAHSTPAALLTPLTPAISNVVAQTSSIAPFEKFEVQFDVKTVATHLNLPYDPTPPPGERAGRGISVDALFSPDNGATILVQPAFLYQPYTRSVRDGRTHFTPSGPPQWLVRFAPQTSGTWHYRLRAQDASGVTFYPPSGSLALDVRGQSANPYTRRGFLRVSQRDRRYFEFQDGTPFIGLGYNAYFRDSALVEQAMQRYEQYGMNFMRVWMSEAGINSSNWSSWAWPNQPWNGYLPAVHFDTHNTFNGADVSLKLDETNRCYFSDFWQGGIPVQPNTAYHVTARVKLSDVSGPDSPGDYGFVLKQGGWPDDTCSGGTTMTPYATGTTGWITVTGLYTTTSRQHWLDYLYLARENVTGGTIYIDDVRLWRADDPARVNLLREPNANSHLYFDPMNSAEWDEYIESAAQHGVYLKIVVDEKNDWVLNRITADGKMTNEASNDNFYAQPDTRARWLQQAWWRYIIARWGYNSAIHSFEYINEGDPYNGNHYEAAAAMASYFKQHDPSRHMVTTSMWHSFPAQEFWANPRYSDLAYADLHAYSSTGWGRDTTFVDPSWVEQRAEHVRSGNASIHIAGANNASTPIMPRSLVVRGPGEWIVRYWMKATGFTSNCGFGSTGGAQRIRWQIDGGVYWGGREGIVPASPDGRDFICTSPDGAYGWTQIQSNRDRNGALLPPAARLILTDTLPHSISLHIENRDGMSGDAWIDDVELVSPSGVVVPVIGQFDMTLLDEDTAWANRAYGELYGAASPVGAPMPLVRGEAGINDPYEYGWNRAINSDTLGIWLHNNLWGQVNPGGMTDLFWWSAETIDQNESTGRYTHIYTNYLTYGNFMRDIPINNGFYQDAKAQTSNDNLRAWGQRDDMSGRMHLWMQNTQHTWKRVVYGPPVAAITGAVTIPNMPAGKYQVTWWDTYSVTQPIFLTQTITASGSLILALPLPLQTDIAAKIQRIGGDGLLRGPRALFVPGIIR